MRYPDKEKFHFGMPCWSADDIKNYTGPIFRATVSWVSSNGGHDVHNDHECPSMEVLQECVRKQMVYRCNNRPRVTYGTHTGEKNAE